MRQIIQNFNFFLNQDATRFWYACSKRYHFKIIIHLARFHCYLKQLYLNKKCFNILYNKRLINCLPHLQKIICSKFAAVLQLASLTVSLLCTCYIRQQKEVNGCYSSLSAFSIVCSKYLRICSKLTSYINSGLLIHSVKQKKIKLVSHT